MVGLRTALRRGTRGPASEHVYRRRTSHGAEYFTSRQEHDELTVVVRRFPGCADVPVGAAARTFVLVHGLGVSSRYFTSSPSPRSSHAGAGCSWSICRATVRHRIRGET